MLRFLRLVRLLKVLGGNDWNLLVDKLSFCNCMRLENNLLLIFFNLLLFNVSFFKLLRLVNVMLCICFNLLFFMLRDFNWGRFLKIFVFIFCKLLFWRLRMDIFEDWKLLLVLNVFFLILLMKLYFKFIFLSLVMFKMKLFLIFLSLLCDKLSFCRKWSLWKVLNLIVLIRFWEMFNVFRDLM